MNSDEPAIPETTIKNWQRIVNLIARLADVPASLVMRTQAPHHSVLVASGSRKNPYDVGLQFELSEKLYCYGVIRDGELVVEEASSDPIWKDNDDMEYGMSFYVGYPLHWPDGEVFGTICMLDKRRNRKALLFREGLLEFARVIEADLKLLVEANARIRLEQELQMTLDQLEIRVEERTTELEEANTALRVLLLNVEKARDEYDANIQTQIKGIIVPILDKLRGQLKENVVINAYLDLLENNLGSMTASRPNPLSTFFEKLTPSEQNISMMIMSGKTTKDIANILAREPSTIEFHRNNIRKKLGLNKSGKNLRSKLLSIQ